jgi:hypothetical protein
MSPHAANSLVHDLVEMAKAFEELPYVREQLRVAETTTVRDGETIARLEIRIMDMKSREDELLSCIRSLEVERDDASFCELEANYKATAAVAALRSVFSNVGEALKTLQPEPKAEPVADPFVAPIVSSSPLQAEALPTGSDSPTPEGGERDIPLSGEHVPSQEWSASANPDTVKSFDDHIEGASTEREANPEGYSYWPYVNRASQFS